jgi:hypothetical protein
VQKVYFAKFEPESLRVVRARDGWLVDGLVGGVVMVRNPGWQGEEWWTERFFWRCEVGLRVSTLTPTPA